jgi:hypothetical protein
MGIKDLPFYSEKLVLEHIILALKPNFLTLKLKFFQRKTLNSVLYCEHLFNPPYKCCLIWSLEYYFSNTMKHLTTKKLVFSDLHLVAFLVV